MKAKQYITQISGEDLRELAALTNVEPGFLIRIDKSGDKWKIGIDEKALAVALNGFYRNGGMAATTANCTKISFNPPN